jgi:DNA-binding Lrp family transcriptional regulator
MAGKKGATKRRVWTESEDNKLLKMRDASKPFSAIAKAVNRSEQSCYNRSSKLTSGKPKKRAAALVTTASEPAKTRPGLRKAKQPVISRTATLEGVSLTADLGADGKFEVAADGSLIVSKGVVLRVS